jgi:hypothetical protein
MHERYDGPGEVEDAEDQDDWEPGAPSLRAMAPSVVGGAIIPLAVYYLVRHHVHGDAPALAIAGVPAVTWVAVQWWRQRRIDPIGAIVVFGFVAGLIASAALGGNAYVLKVRDSAFTCLFGFACLVSLRFRRPVMFYIGRSLATGDDPVRRAAYDGLLDMPGGPHTFRVITATWGVGLMGEAGLRFVLAAVLPTGQFLAASPALAAVMFGGMFAFTVWFSRVARQRGQEALELEALQVEAVQVAPDPG